MSTRSFVDDAATAQLILSCRVLYCFSQGSYNRDADKTFLLLLVNTFFFFSVHDIGCNLM